MICTVHHKLNTPRDLAKLAYNEFIAVPLIMVRDMAFKIRVCDISKVTDKDIRIFDSRLNVYFFIVSGYRMYIVWIWNISVFYFISPRDPHLFQPLYHYRPVRTNTSIFDDTEALHYEVPPS